MGSTPDKALDRGRVYGNALQTRLTLSSGQAREVHALLEAGLASGEVQPLPVTEFRASRAVDALRHLAAGAHLPLSTRSWKVLGLHDLNMVSTASNMMVCAGNEAGNCPSLTSL